MSFVIGNYRALDQPGARHRAAVLEQWRGEDLRGSDEVALAVLPPEIADHARDIVTQLQVAAHPHLLRVNEVVADGARVALVSPWPRGGRLRELLDRRGMLTPAETLTVLIPLASVLAALHAAGLRHTGLCPESVWFDEHGRPLVGSLAASRLVADLNDGLPDGCRDVAPEVVRGERAGGTPVTAAADIFSLGSLALQCLTCRPAWPADDAADVLVQSAAGLWPDLPDDAGPAGLVGLVRAMLAAQPDRRPTAAALVDELAEVASPAPIRFGSGATQVPISTDRWRGWESSRRLSPRPAGPQSDEPSADRPALDPPEPDRSEPDRPETDRSDPDRPETDRSDPDRLKPGRSKPHRSEPDRSGPTPLARAGIALLCGLVVTLVVIQLSVWLTGWEDVDSAPSAQAASADGAAPAGEPDWSAVVGELDAARARALAAADPALLGQVYVAGSAAGQADMVTIGGLADRGWRVQDGVHVINSVNVEPTAGSGNAAGSDGVPGMGDAAIRLSVVDTLPAHPVVDVAGQQVGFTPARPEQHRIMVVQKTDDGYRISDITGPE